MADDNAPDITTSTPDTGGSSGEPSLHDTITEAFEQVETRDTPPAEGAPVPAGADAPPSAGGRVRDPATGKFVAAPEGAPPPAGKPPAPTAKPEVAPTGKQPVAAPQRPQAAPPKPDGAPQQPQAVRPPVSWKPAAREHWAKLPLEVQQEVVRRETETARTLQESAKAREALTHVQSLIQPYAHNINASGGNALNLMGSLFKADNTLRHGTIQEKATLIADIIKGFGVDITALDSILAGQQVQVDPNAALAEKLRREMQQQLQPVMQQFNRMQGARQQAIQQINTEASGEVENFATDGQHEFFEDVRQDMADIIDLHTQRGATISLQDAYDRAIRINPQVSDIVAKRADAERVNAQAAAAQRARRTAASIGGSPAPAGAGPGPAGDDRRAQIEAAFDASGNS